MTQTGLIPAERIEKTIYAIGGERVMLDMLASNTELSQRLDELEKEYDRQFKVVFEAIRSLMAPTSSKPKQIGFRPNAGKRKRWT